MQRYRIEKSRSRQEFIDGVAPLETEHSDNLTDAKREMNRMADKGQFYAAVFIARDGEVCAETADVES